MTTDSWSGEHAETQAINSTDAHTEGPHFWAMHPPAPEEEGLGPFGTLTPSVDQQAEDGNKANKKKMPLYRTGTPAFRVGKPSITAGLTGAFSARIPCSISGLNGFLGNVRRS